MLGTADFSARAAVDCFVLGTAPPKPRAGAVNRTLTGFVTSTIIVAIAHGRGSVSPWSIGDPAYALHRPAERENSLA